MKRKITISLNYKCNLYNKNEKNNNTHNYAINRVSLRHLKNEKFENQMM